MGRQRYSDLPFEVGEEMVVVVQPSQTIGMTPGMFLGQREEFLEQVFEDTLAFRGLRVIGILQCSRYEDEPGRPVRFEPLNAPLAFGPIPRSPEFNHLLDRGVDTFVSCQREDGSDLRLVIPWLATLDLSTIMFHLMVKQMAPGLPACNWVDCSERQWDLYRDQQLFHFTSGEVERIRELGFVSVASECFWGNIGGREPMASWVNKHSLGFILMPGMNTRAGCGGFDQWLQFLVVQKYLRDTARHQSQLAQIVGPKPRRRR